MVCGLADDVKALAFEPGLDDFLAVIVHGYTQDDESLRSIFMVELDEPRNFRFAGFAPSGPEIDEHDLAFVLIEADSGTVEGWNRYGGFMGRGCAGGAWTLLELGLQRLGHV